MNKYKDFFQTMTDEEFFKLLKEMNVVYTEKVECSSTKRGECPMQVKVKFKLKECYYNRLHFYIDWDFKTKNKKTKAKLWKKVQKEMRTLSNNIEFN